MDACLLGSVDEGGAVESSDGLVVATVLVQTGKDGVPVWVSQVCPIEPDALTRILLGEKMAEADRRQILTWTEERNPPLPVMDVRFDSLTQELRVVPIDACV